MISPKAFTALAVTLLIPIGIKAQVASRLEAGSLVTGDNSGTQSSVFRVAPDIAVSNPNAHLAAKTSAWLIGQQWQLVDGAVAGTLVSPTVYGVRAQLIGNASRAFDTRSLGTNQIDVETRVSVALSDGSGVWIGGGVTRPWKIAETSRADVMDAGAWVKIGEATITGRVTNQYFLRAAQNDTTGGITSCAGGMQSDIAMALNTAYAADGSPVACTHSSSMHDMVSSIYWAHSRFEFTGTAGYRVGTSFDVSSDSREWGSGTGTFWVAPRLAVVLGGGRQPANIEQGLPARTFGTLGMAVGYWPTARVPVTPATVTALRTFDVAASADGMQRITVHVGGVERVEIAGDFSDWQPLALNRRGRDTWELVVPISAGMHTIDVRVDGGPWFAPPGLPLFRDGFGGIVGRFLAGS